MSRETSLLITGASGFVGQSYLDFLDTLPVEEKPGSIALVSRSTTSKIDDQRLMGIDVQHFQSDLTLPWEIDFEPTHILNLAADGTVSSYTKGASDTFVQISQNLANWCSEKDRPEIFHASSGACYGVIPISQMTTDADQKKSHLVTEKKELFIQSRLKAEEILLATEDQGILNVRIGRLFSFIGRHLVHKPQYAVHAFVRGALENSRIEILGNPQTQRSYLSADDMSRWIHRSLFSKKVLDTLDIGSEVPVTLMELATYIASLTNSTVEILNPNADGDVYVASNAITRANLNEQETKTWKTSILEYLTELQREGQEA
jgi:nucleoside-diphosphate-sugar epimerase